jgi:hypothetical protein
MSFGINAARFQLLRQAENTLFRVWASDLPGSQRPDGLFEQGQYLLRIHEPGYQEAEALELELSWLAAIQQAAIFACSH